MQPLNSLDISFIGRFLRTASLTYYPHLIQFRLNIPQQKHQKHLLERHSEPVLQAAKPASIMLKFSVTVNTRFTFSAQRM
jgi:hypothetical protein